MGMGLFLIRSSNRNVIKGWVQCVELQTFVTNRKVEVKKGGCARKQRLRSPSQALLSRASGAAAAAAHAVPCSICSGAAAGSRGHRRRGGASLRLPCRTHKCWGWRGG